jgi:hypothetical protein
LQHFSAKMTTVLGFNGEFICDVRSGDDINLRCCEAINYSGAFQLLFHDDSITMVKVIKKLRIGVLRDEQIVLLAGDYSLPSVIDLKNICTSDQVHDHGHHAAKLFKQHVDTAEHDKNSMWTYRRGKRLYYTFKEGEDCGYIVLDLTRDPILRYLPSQVDFDVFKGMSGVAVLGDKPSAPSGLLYELAVRDNDTSTLALLQRHAEQVFAEGVQRFIAE